jgi:hypothetical protein
MYDSHHPSAFDVPLNTYRMAALNVSPQGSQTKGGKFKKCISAIDDAAALYRGNLTHTAECSYCPLLSKVRTIIRGAEFNVVWRHSWNT